MINKINGLSEKISFGIGLTLILGVPLLSLFSPFNLLTTFIVQGIAFFVSTLFILSAADKRRFAKKK